MRIMVVSVLCVGALCAHTTGCSAPVETEEPVAVGVASMPLTAMGGSGALYRLTAATFAVNGPVSGTFSTDGLPDSATVDLQLTVGAYQITLQPGWVLERTLGGVTQPTQAVLVSANPASFAIADQVVTQVSFVFQVDGDVIPMGQGILRLGIAVQETNGTCMIDADCSAGQVCDVATGQCVDAAASCNTDADCNAGEWCFTSMSFGNFCVATGMGGLGAGCDSMNVFSCNPHLVCIDLGTGASCHLLCNVAAPMCGGGEVCAPFSTQDGNPGDVGACIVP